MKKLSMIVSVYNEEGNLEHFIEVARNVAKGLRERENPWETEILFVNDGSSDKSREILNGFADTDSACKVIHFSRNFGHEAAMIAGIDHAAGEFLVCLDADLQNPPELLPSMIDEYERGAEVVLMAREENKSAGFIKKITSNAFYGLLNRLSGTQFERNVSDFFGISGRVAEIMRTEYREKNRYLRGYIQQVGFKKSVLKYKAPERFSGHSKYSIKKLTKMAVHTLNCFAVTPLRAGACAAILSIILTIASLVYYIVFWVNNGYGSGTALLCSLLTFLFSVLFLLLGVIGEYLGGIMSEIRNRPIYIVEEIREK